MPVRSCPSCVCAEVLGAYAQLCRLIAGAHHARPSRLRPSQRTSTTPGTPVTGAATPVFFCLRTPAAGSSHSAAQRC
jgi:hypothetical protein